MSQEVESLWGAMKDVQYTRTLKLLKHSLRDARNLEASLSVSLDTIVEAVQAVSGTFWFYERYRDGRIYPKSVYGGGNLGNVSLLPGEGIAGGVILSGEATIVYDCQKDPRWQGKVDDKTGFKTESMICVPLVSQDNVFGCIQIINKKRNFYFDDSDLEFVKGLAQDSARLFEDNGMLEDYYSGREREKEAQRAITFMQVMGAHNMEEMEFQLRRIEQFSTLKVKEQQEVLALAKSMYAYFGKSTKKSLFGRRGEKK
ncbi:GAF domain-containing protein [Chakrabartyella piscis]|uniref:GAF domain-containing protein n=1 Tax=Chakrabartyella piscis TaxID=2918914 RepID=UPI00295857DD|nr:GAF domain-containing protein [Chakrabartyella piscis]